MILKNSILFRRKNLLIFLSMVKRYPKVEIFPCNSGREHLPQTTPWSWDLRHYAFPDLAPKGLILIKSGSQARETRK